MNSLGHISLSVLIIIICGAGFNNISAQQINKNTARGKISGRVFDKLTHKPLQFAVFAVTPAGDTTKGYRGESDSQGNFAIADIPFGIYKARISLLGYQSRTRKNIILSAARNELKIDTLMLMPLAITKEEVKVIAQKERIVYDKENKNKIIINPDKDWGVNAMELLENTPMVHVDFDEKNISLMGQQGTIIYVNGIPGSFYGIESVEDLKIMSSDEIDQFELVTNPTAEYGTYSPGGIINIITKKNNNSSYTGNAGLGGNSDNRYNGDINGRYNSPAASTGVTYLNSNSDHKTNSSILRQVTFGNTTDILNQSSEADYRNIANRFSLKLAVNSPDNYNINGITSFNEGYNTSSNIFNNYYSGEDHNNTALSKNLLKLFNTGITFSKKLSGQKNLLKASFAFSNNWMSIENNYNQRQLMSDQTPADTVMSGKDRSGNLNNYYTLMLSYNNIFSQYANLSLGYNGSYKELQMRSDYFLYDPLTRENVELNNKKIDQQYFDNTHTISVNISGKAFDIQYAAGLRTNLKYSSTENTIGNYSFNYNFLSFDPNFSLIREIFEGNNIQFMYSGNTTFPLNNQLNPFTDYSDSTNLITGNPELKPGTSKYYNISYFHTGTDFFMRILCGYANFKDQVNAVIIPVSSLVTKTTYANVASSDNLLFSIFLSKKFFSCLDLEPAFIATKSKYSGTGVRNEGTSWSSSIYSMLSLSNLRFETSFNYSSSAVTEQTRTKPVWFMDAGVKLLLLHKALSFTLKATDIFNTKNSNSDNYGPDFIITNNIKQTTRIVSLNISYFFRLEAEETIEPDKPLDVLPTEF